MRKFPQIYLINALLLLISVCKKKPSRTPVRIQWNKNEFSFNKNKILRQFCVRKFFENKFNSKYTFNFVYGPKEASIRPFKFPVHILPYRQKPIRSN